MMFQVFRTLRLIAGILTAVLKVYLRTGQRVRLFQMRQRSWSDAFVHRSNDLKY